MAARRAALVMKTSGKRKRKSPAAVAKGRRNRAAGGSWEKRIDAACTYYRDEGIALIDKTPEPMRPVKRLGKGQFIAIFTAAGQPDYKGTLRGGRSIVLEAKHTQTDRLRRSVITPTQEAYLDLHLQLGAATYILAEVDGGAYRIPWEEFRDMSETYGRAYMTAEEMTSAGYNIEAPGGFPDFLNGLEEDERRRKRLKQEAPLPGQITIYDVWDGGEYDD